MQGVKSDVDYPEMLLKTTIYNRISIWKFLIFWLVFL